MINGLTNFSESSLLYETEEKFIMINCKQVIAKVKCAENFGCWLYLEVVI